MGKAGVTAGDVERVVRDVMERRKISDGLYSFRKRALNVLVGSRSFSLPLPAGMSYYEVKSLVERVERICDDIDKAKRHVGQVDLEDAIASASAQSNMSA